MSKSLLFITVSLFFSLIKAGYWDQQELSTEAMVIVPVTNAAEEQIIKEYGDSYMMPVLEMQEDGKIISLRSYQPLFNEVVKVIEVKEDEVCCLLNNAYYYTSEGVRSNIFWMPKKDIMYLKDLKQKVDPLDAVPAPYSENFSKRVFVDGILTLAFPWCDYETGTWYSAGTRFVRIASQDTEEAYAVKMIDFASYSVKVALVPKKDAVVIYSKDNFVRLLKCWTTSASKIPYVWGGCSFISLVEPDNFISEVNIKNGQKVTFWHRPESKPYTGFECASLILRAAQVCGMPYFCKTTVAALSNLRELNESDTLEEGDLIWYPIHIMVVGDLKKNELIEARGYPHGFGIVQSIHISKFFEGVHSFEELLKAYKAKQPLKILNKAGHVCKQITQMKILKLNSIY